MSLFARLRLCLVVLLARDARTWRRLRDYCAREAVEAGTKALLAELDAVSAHEALKAQLLAGTRTTRQAEILLAEAHRLTTRTPSC